MFSPTTTHLRRHAHSRVAVLWLLVALLPKLLLPTGFMPGDASTGRLVVICSAGFFKVAQVDERGIIIKRERQHASATHCPFAAAAQDVNLVPALPVMRVTPALPIAIAFIDPAIASRGCWHAHQSRAPPLYS